mmetsp:Transcript_20865/g.71787  ORF Transcript_20865/g.71787 Transcript_20865/m.71787 type:complete len:252 (-) Transcript_20865:7-762(-)
MPRRVAVGGVSWADLFYRKERTLPSRLRRGNAIRPGLHPGIPPRSLHPRGRHRRGRRHLHEIATAPRQADRGARRRRPGASGSPLPHVRARSMGSGQAQGRGLLPADLPDRRLHSRDGGAGAPHRDGEPLLPAVVAGLGLPPHEPQGAARGRRDHHRRRGHARRRDGRRRRMDHLDLPAHPRRHPPARRQLRVHDEPRRAQVHDDRGPMLKAPAAVSSTKERRSLAATHVDSRRHHPRTWPRTNKRTWQPL